ncbi:MAG TPA: LysR substrate-binding domain-containing protein [Cellulomonas sp.]
MSEHDETELPLAPAPPTPAGPARPAGTDPHAFRLLIVPGVVPASWLRTWSERMRHVPIELVHAGVAEQHAVLADGGADAALLRLPVDRDLVSAIPLYVETTVLVLPKDHLLTALDEVTPADLADEMLLLPADDVLSWTDTPGERSALPAPATTAEAVELVAAGVGLLAVPQSLARLHHRRDLTHRPLTDAPGSRVALAWLRDRDGDPLIEELIGIVRGRTVNSSRGAGAAGRPGGAHGRGANGDADNRTADGRGTSGGTRGRGTDGRSGNRSVNGRQARGGRRRSR